MFYSFLKFKMQKNFHELCNAQQYHSDYRLNKKCKTRKYRKKRKKIVNPQNLVLLFYQSNS